MARCLRGGDTPAASPPSAPTPTVDPSRQPARVHAALISVTTARQLRLGKMSEGRPIYALPKASCVGAMEYSSDITYSYFRQWEQGLGPADRRVLHDVMAYQYWSPAKNVAAIRRQVPKCTEYNDDSGNTIVYTGDAALPMMAGVEDAYAYCERGKRNGFTLCTAFLTRGNLLALLFVGAPATDKTSTSLFHRLVQEASTALAAA